MELFQSGVYKLCLPIVFGTNLAGENASTDDSAFKIEVEEHNQAKVWCSSYNSNCIAFIFTDIFSLSYSTTCKF